MPALSAKMLGAKLLYLFIGLWTAIGVYLAFAIVAEMREGTLWKFLVPLVFVAFSGADVVGTVLTGFQFGPHTDILWGPQHAIPAWIGACLVLKLGQWAESLAVLPVVLVAIAFWSVFATIGLAPFVLLVMVRKARASGLADVVCAVLLIPALLAVFK